MGEQAVSIVKDEAHMDQFVRHLLNDVYALDLMLKGEMFETDVIRIGAEQEMALVDNKTFKPATINMDIINKIGHKYPWLDTELAKFNLETNLLPRVFTGTCLSDMEKENVDNLNILRKALHKEDAKLILTGILPTLRKHDLELDNLTPKPRYRALIDSIHGQLMGSAFELRLTGIDELLVKHNSPLLEACNTSFQVHLQVTPNTFTKMYNISQAIAAPIMALASNSPILFGRRLWHETRIALFQQALDTRTTHEHMRERSPRVNFGSGWLDKSILEIYKEDIARFRVLLAGDVVEDSLQVLRAGGIPKLRALQVHNSTVYRWNRPCYGISENGMPHLRIENRVLPAGPTVVDEMANAALWLGAMVGMAEEYDDITKHMSYEDVRDNFAKAAKFGMDTSFNWVTDKKIGSTEMIGILIEKARIGLTKQNVATADIDKYLGIVKERSEKHMTGARWQLRAFTKLKKEMSRDEAIAVMTATIIKNQETEQPVHTWELPDVSDMLEYSPAKMKVEEFMETDLFTVHKEDLVDLVADLMDWRRVRYMPVEDKKGNLVGLITSRLLLRHYAHLTKQTINETVRVKDIMIAEPATISPDTMVIDAMRIMREKKIGCLPVVNGTELVGVITEMDYLQLSSRLMERIEVTNKRNK